MKYQSFCSYFTRLRPNKRPYCLRGNTYELIVKNKAGVFYLAQLANCENCPLSENQKMKGEYDRI